MNRSRRGPRKPARRRAAVPALTVGVQIADRAWRSLLPQATRTVRRAALAAYDAALSASTERCSAMREGVGSVEIALSLADDSFVRQLNRRYRGLDKPTNVLSFPALSPPAPIAADIPLPLGDIVLARQTVAAEAAAQGKSVPDHTAHLVVHGVLHLMGYDHEEPGEAEGMEALEIAILAGLGIADPYEAKQPFMAPPPRRANGE